MNFTPQDIINENLERRKALAARANAYNPITGECPTRRVAARHRSADLPGQADGSHKPRAAYAALTPNHRRASASHSECSEISDRSTTLAANRSAHTRSVIGAHAP